MAKYSDIKGFTVQTLSSDPVASGLPGGSWASGGNLNTGRDYAGGCGSQTAGLVFSGAVNPPSTKSGEVEQVALPSSIGPR